MVVPPEWLLLLRTNLPGSATPRYDRGHRGALERAIASERVNPGTVRRALHAVHALTSLALAGTGALIHWPELRLELLGGYGLALASLHEWTGFAFMAAPLLSLALAARPLASDLGSRLRAPGPPSWRKLHIALTLALTLVLSLSGVALWLQEHLSPDAADLALEAHVWASWAIAVSIPVHLLAARRKIVEIVAVRLGLRPPPEADPFFDES
jgi:cytochrome b subunit of formate dehydrogenase